MDEENSCSRPQYIWDKAFDYDDDESFMVDDYHKAESVLFFLAHNGISS